MKKSSEINNAAPVDLSQYQVRKTNPIVKVISYILLTLWTLINIYPFFWLITYSLKTNQEILGDNPMGFPEKLMFSNYVEALKPSRFNFLQYLKNSTIVAVLTIAITILAAMMATYALTRLIWKGRKTVNSFFMLGLTIPMHAAIIPIFMSISKLGLKGTYWEIVIPYSAFALSMAILICTGFMIEIPKDLDEAACIDGCGVWGTFFRVILPLMTPAVSTIGIYTFLQCWNEYMLASILPECPKTLPIGIASFTSGHNTDYGYRGAALVVSTLPILIVYAFLSNKIQEGFIAGAVKG